MQALEALGVLSGTALRATALSPDEDVELRAQAIGLLEAHIRRDPTVRATLLQLTDAGEPALLSDIAAGALRGVESVKGQGSKRARPIRAVPRD